MKNEIIKISWEEFIDNYKEYFESNENIWLKKLNQVKLHINATGTKPSSEYKNKDIKQMGQWLLHQKTNYNINIGDCKQIMKNEIIKISWEEFIDNYKEYFESNENVWLKNLNQLKFYIDTNNVTPSSSDKNKEIKQLGQWLSDQKKNYNIDIAKCKYIMKTEIIKISWEEFIDNHKEYFKSNENIWLKKLNQVKFYIDINNAIPSTIDKNKDIKQMGQWLSNQKTNYNIDIAKCKCTMKNEIIKMSWEEFIDNYKEYFESNENIWLKKLNQVKNHIDVTNVIPSIIDKNKDIEQLGQWLSHQKQNYNINIEDCKNIMKTEFIKISWEEFMNNYKEYFESNENIWLKNLNQLKFYIDTNNAKPQAKDKNEDVKKLGIWLIRQKTNYNIDMTKCKQIMKIENIKISWEEFICDNKYKEYFESNENIWFEKLNHVKLYIDANSRIPTHRDKNEEIKRIGQWLSHQKANYNINIKECKNIMKNEYIKSSWEQFKNDDKYKKYSNKF
jgi:hypothetical protein